MAYKYRVLVGGIGDDAHSVGISLITLGFKEAGYYVHNLGIRNSLRKFFDCAPEFEIIMISNKNGHAELFMDDFPDMLNAYKLKDETPKLWYLGGSLSVNESEYLVKKKYLGMGFTDVYPKPIPFVQIIKNVERDISLCEIKMGDSSKNVKALREKNKLDIRLVSDKKWSGEDLNLLRKEVLKEYETGKEVDLQTYVSNKGKTASLDELLWYNKLKNKSPLLQPRTGVADIVAQTELLQYLESHGSNINSVQLDASSRSKMYSKAKQGMELSIQYKASLLNGFPIPVYGVKKLQGLINSLKNPFQLRAGGPDHRFTYEIALKAGVSGLEGGFICYLLPYDKLTSPVESLLNWQYIDRLCTAYCENQNVHINREYFGTLTATLITPSTAIVVNIIQSILSAQQGVRSITVGYAEQGNRTQDIAAMKVMEEMVSKYLRLYNFRQVKLTTVFHQFMAAFPTDSKKAEELILNSSITATLSKATKIMVKTTAEAFRIPDMYDNAQALKICKIGNALANSVNVNFQLLEIEQKMIRKEVDAIMEVIRELGNGAISLGAIRAIEEGIVDIPWSPNIYNSNKVVTLRDVNGAVRFSEFGDLPFNNQIKSFHAEHVHVRKQMERDSSLFSLLEKDLSRIWKNDYKQWPLDGCYIT